MKLDIIRHSEWADTKFTLHLISQILGKIKLETAQQEPQWAHVTLAITPNGFSTGLLFHRDKTFQIDLDIYESRILVNVDGNLCAVPLETNKSIKNYFEEIFAGLSSKGVELTINPKPQEMAYKTNLNEDETPLTFHWEHALRGLKLFQFALREQLKFVGPMRCRKMKPALFWGTFDVSLLVLHGVAEPFPQNKVIEKAAFDEQFIEYGFWLGDDKVDVPSFFTLPYPFINKQLDSSRLKPADAYWDASLSEHFLKLDKVAASDNPSKILQEFFRSTFDILSEELDWQGCSYYFTPLDMPEQKEREK
ncbi:DUF5996 family protein [Planococcus dechangensis]|uniref:DUF5996 family protein n=1 Tax=Planococcus dechangensis TaxID=1176255 RepID=A0ABV9MC96_9BACL